MKNVFLQQHSVARYYDDNYDDYIKGWSPEHLHYGFWYSHTKSHEESLLNHVKDICTDLDIRDNDTILDAGCGTGGSCRFIAGNYDAMIVGITLSDTLFKASKGSQFPTSNKIFILPGDFTKTSFKNETFSKIFSIESVCHTRHKTDFLKEAYRLLKPGGRLIVSDAYQVNKTLNSDECKIFNEWLDGLHVPNLALIDRFPEELIKIGFTQVRFINHSSLIEKSYQLMHDGVFESMPMYYIDYVNGNITESRFKHRVALCRQKECIERNIWIHGRYIADKPAT